MSTSRFALAAATFVAASLLAACAAPPSDLDLTLQHSSRQGSFVVRLEPPASDTPLNRIHAWQVRVTGIDGAPVTQASIGVQGGMPQHGHGFPTQPRVTRELSPGVYALEGVKFSMTGWWDMRLDIRAGDTADTAVFNIIVDGDTLRR